MIYLVKLLVAQLVKKHPVEEVNFHNRVHKRPTLYCPSPISIVTIRNMLIVSRWRKLVQRTTLTFEDHRFSSICRYLFNIFAATVHILSSPPGTEN